MRPAPAGALGAVAAVGRGPQARATVCAVVVTHNRKALLRECLQALASQTRPADEIIVVDNASTDGSPDLVREEFPGASLVVLPENRGGAGGFHEGMRVAHERGSEWLWLLDDDTIATPTALELLLESLGRLDGLPAPVLMASKVVWTDERLHPKNLPWVRLDERWNEAFVLAAARGLVLLRSASFVSILVHRRAIDEHGLPHRHYFIWGDDGEYTARILREGTGFMVPDSLVHHKTAGKDSVHRERKVGQYYYEVRNKLFMLRGHSWERREKVALAMSMTMGLWQFLRSTHFSPASLRVIARAVRDGLREPAE